MALSPDPEFDIDRHRLAESRWFEDFTPGERFVLPSRTMTDALFAAFQLASAIIIRSITTPRIWIAAGTPTYWLTACRC